MNTQEKIQRIESLFSILDNQSQGATDLSLPAMQKYYPLEMYSSAIGGTIATGVTPHEIGKQDVSGGLVLDDSMISMMTVPYSSVRGFAKFHPGKIIRSDLFAFGKGFYKLGITDAYGTFDYRKFTLLSKKGEGKMGSSVRFADENRLAATISAISQIEFFSDMFDTIEISSSKTRIAIPTTPDGSKEFLKMRDVPEGKRSRPMIINWVAEHVRELKKGETIVKKHKRGRTEFKWMGYDVIVTKNT